MLTKAWMAGRVGALALGVSLVAWAMAGCCTSKRCQLEQVAKDWAYTIRASQVIPVYPLTEDLQPGDVFLVQVPIDRQQRVYKRKGFLPLDNHIDRLHPVDYRDFYGRSFIDDGASGEVILPRDWIRPDGDADSWSLAPGASFPSYSFSVRRGSGINAAIPVQGIPVGLGFMGSDSANGSVVIEDARTLGIDTMSLYRALQDWARANRDFLANFAGEYSTETSYLRVVTRVYATGQLTVVLNDASSVGGGGDAGVAREVVLADAAPPAGREDTEATTLDNYLANLEKLNEIVEEMSPGASFRFTAASSRSVTLEEEFDPPLILGYLGFDVAIAPGGLLGPPIPTQAVLDRRRYGDNRASEAPAELIARRQLWSSLYDVLKARSEDDGRAAEIKARLDALADLIPEEPVSVYYERRETDEVFAVDLVEEGDVAADPASRTYDDFVTYREGLRRSVSLLDRTGGMEEELGRLRAELERIDEHDAGSIESEATSDILLYLLERTRQ